MPSEAAAPITLKPRNKITSLQSQEIGRNVWVKRLTEETAKEDLLKPTFWAHVARTLRPFDRIEVMAHDGSWYAELIVRSTTSLDATVGLIKFTEFVEPPVSGADDYDVVWKGPAAKFCIIRIEDKVRVKDGFENKELAAAWLALSPELRAAAA